MSLFNMSTAFDNYIMTSDATKQELIDIWRYEYESMLGKYPTEDVIQSFLDEYADKVNSLERGDKKKLLDYVYRCLEV
jgi:hypothetical protein